MTTGGAVDEVHERVPASPSTYWSRWSRVVGWVLFAGFVLGSATALVVGEHQSSLDRLEADLAAGRTSEVVVSGHGLPSGATGFEVLRVHWRTGLTAQVATVVEARPLAAGRHRVRDLPPEAQVIAPTLADRLHAIDPTTEVRTAPEAGYASTYAGLGVPAWLAGVGLLSMLATLVLLIGGPEPWRATRWAWFWMLGVLPPLGPIAYLALGGPTGLVRRPPPGSARLTGGWAFVIALVVGSGFTSLARVVV